MANTLCDLHLSLGVPWRADNENPLHTFRYLRNFKVKRLMSLNVRCVALGSRCKEMSHHVKRIKLHCPEKKNTIILFVFREFENKNIRLREISCNDTGINTIDY